MNTTDLIRTCDYISIDTSVLMNPDPLLRFIKKYGVALILMRRYIYVYQEVIAELKKHVKSNNPEKSKKAQAAFDIIRKYGCLFQLQNKIEHVNPQTLNRRIADQRFICAVKWYTLQHAQLFITNDKALLKSIVITDQLEAVHGKAVCAASMSSDGDLIEYTLVGKSVTDEDEELDDDAVEKILMEMNDKYVDGRISGVFWGSLCSTILVGGISMLLHSRARGALPYGTKRC